MSSEQYNELYRRAEEFLRDASTAEARSIVKHNDFTEAPNWGNVTLKQVLIDLYRRIEALEQRKTP